MSIQKSNSTIDQTLEQGHDWGLLTIIVTRLALGIVMVFSASFAQGFSGYDDPYYFIKRQLLWTGAGLIVMLVAARIPYDIWQRWSVPLMAVGLVSLLAVVILGTELFGSTRTFFGGSVQPSEPAKIIIIIYVSAWLASKGERIRQVQVGLVPFSVLMGAVTVLVVTQPDISTAILIVSTASIMFFIAGAELRQLLFITLGGGVTFWLVIRYSDYAYGRLSRYQESLWNPLESAEYQVQRAVEALTLGGPFGRGIGNSEAKLPGYLPISWSDNLFAIIGEEAGILGTLLVIFLFALLAYRGLNTALHAPDTFGMLLATGITSLLTLQAILHTAVIVAAAPPTGVTLPFMSYGGSSLLTALGAAGILLNIHRRSRSSQQESVTGNFAYARFDIGGWDWRSRLSGPGSRDTAQSDKSKPRAKPRKNRSQPAKSRPSKSEAAKSGSQQRGRKPREKAYSSPNKGTKKAGDRRTKRSTR